MKLKFVPSGRVKSLVCEFFTQARNHDGLLIVDARAYHFTLLVYKAHDHKYGLKAGESHEEPIHNIIALVRPKTDFDKVAVNVPYTQFKNGLAVERVLTENKGLVGLVNPDFSDTGFVLTDNRSDHDIVAKATPGRIRFYTSKVFPA